MKPILTLMLIVLVQGCTATRSTTLVERTCYDIQFLTCGVFHNDDLLDMRDCLHSRLPKCCNNVGIRYD